MLLEVFAEHLLPTLVAEASSYAIRHAARHAARSTSPQPVRQRQPQPVPRVRMVSATTVLSETPGRARLQVAGLRGDPARAAAMGASLRGLPGVRRVDISALTGNALIHYDPSETSLARIRAALEGPRLVARGRSPLSEQHTAMILRSGGNEHAWSG
jgi:hypothetical protein